MCFEILIRRNMRRTFVPRVASVVARTAACVAVLLAAWSATPALADEWTVAVHIHEVLALSNSDAAGGQDMYRKIWIEPLLGSGVLAYCDNEDNIDVDENHVTPNDWGCTMKVTGGLDTLLRIKIEIWDDDDLFNPDDELDLNPDHKQLGLDMRFWPRTSRLLILGANPGGVDDDGCALGRIKKSGFGGGGDEPAEITFSVTASPAGSVEGDTDGDKLLDTWEVCGLNTDNDRAPELDLKTMGANPFRKDVFVEIDWMADATHSHEPWLPALIQAWTEYDRAYVTNPTVDGIPNPSGIALHLDVGNLYAGYNLNIDGAGPPEFSIGPSGNIDLDLNPTTNRVSATSLPPGSSPTDIGDFGGGNRVPEIGTLLRSGGMNPSHFRQGSTFEVIKNGAGSTPGNFNPIRSGIFHYALFSHALQIAGPVTPTTVGLSENGSANDDFTVALAPLVATPGTIFRQTIDANRDGVPDLGAATVTGPLGLPVDGTVAHHAQTFIHELGHNLGLFHGPFNINGDPNYLSTMNIAFFAGLTFDNVGNDGIADTTGVDYDGDGISDVRRFHFSHQTLPTLTEAALNENIPIDPLPTPALTRFSCPPGAVPPGARVVRADRPPNWDCDGTTGETPPNVGNNNINSFAVVPSPPNEILLGYSDYARIQNGGLELLPDRPSPSIEELQQMDSRTQRIHEPTSREWFEQRCRQLRRITFEEFPEDTKVDDEYAPDVRFLADDLRKPVIVAPSGRNGVATGSPDRSLLNSTTSGAPAPLVMTFGEPQRVVRLQVGHAGFTQLPGERARAMLRAWDQRGLPMGMIVRDLIQSNPGVTNVMTAVAVFPDELILRVELSFETLLERTGFGKPVLVNEPVLMDNLDVCGRLDETGLVPYIPPVPKFGDLRVSLAIESEAVHETGMTPSGNPILVHMPFTGLPVQVNGASNTTAASLTRPEGTMLSVSAPTTFSGWRFLYWRHSSGVSFGNGVTSVPITMLKDGKLTAVYQGRRTSREPQDQRPDPAPGDCACCVCKCPCKP
jgi:hypothetical protein